MSVKNYTIKVEGLRLYAYHGVYPEENKLGQEFEIDLTMTLDLPPSLRDDEPDNVVSYWDAIQTIKAVFSKKTYKLLETAAMAILDSLGGYPQIRHATIHLKKLAPPIPLSLDSVGVILDRDYTETS